MRRPPTGARWILRNQGKDIRNPKAAAPTPHPQTVKELVTALRNSVLTLILEKTQQAEGLGTAQLPHLQWHPVS